ncbi:MAG: galactofuranosyltransferase, partial [Bacteroidaceae bacterium]|nr:galactofuranosyltransferase [Bacteroidaceae bacterium]
FMPVIIWKQAALAPFILENKCGIAVDSLRDINSTLAHLTDAEYKEMQENARRVGTLISQGHFTQTALSF